MKKCPFCAEEIQEEAVICKHCKSNLNEAQEARKLSSTEVKSDKGFGAVTGLLGGLGCGGLLVILGIVLSLTGIGAIIGLPMILAGILMPFIAPTMGLAQVSGKCPYCSKHLTASTLKGAAQCRYCKRRVVIDNKKFVRVD